jgi:hypothetical protein
VLFFVPLIEVLLYCCFLQVEKALAPRCLRTFSLLASLMQQQDKELGSYRAAVKASLEGQGVDAAAEVQKLNAVTVNLRYSRTSISGRKISVQENFDSGTKKSTDNLPA